MRLDRKTGAIETYSPDVSDPTTIHSEWTRVVFSDRGGVLWFGFISSPVSKLNPVRRKLNFYRTIALSFLEDEADRMWFGSRGRGLRLLDLKTGAVQSFLDEQLSPTWTMRIVRGEDKSLWLGTIDLGLFHFTPSTGTVEKFDTENGGLASDGVFALIREGSTLWLGTADAGLGHFDIKTRTAKYFKSDPANPATLSSDTVVALWQDKSRPDVLWAGTPSGLNEVDKRSGKVVRYIHDPAKPTSLSHDHVTDIREDRAGRLWIATWGGGLNLLDRKTGTFKIYKTGQAAGDVLYGILEDKAGNLWMTSNDGLIKFDPEQGRFIITYREGDGLQKDEFAQGSFHQGPSGRFYIGGGAGFNVFIPEDLKPDTYVPPMALTRFEILGESRSIPDRVTLSYRDRWFSVAFSALSYASPTQNRYKYRLTGFHGWIETDRRFASYASLPPGDYTLEILGSNAHGVWNEKGISIPIHVQPPPWRTWWAFTSYGVIGLLIVGLFIRRQRNQLEGLKKTHRLSELEKEMALTSAVQEGFFPAERSVRDRNLGLEAFYRAAAQCGGDWWWYESRGDTYFILVGDATGHGVGSAMVTAAAAASFRSLGPSVDDETRLQAMSEEVLRVSRGQYHMTLTAVTVNVTTGRYVVLSAGGVPVFTLPPYGQPRVLMCPGTPLGSAEFELGRREGQLVPGERLLVLTDGIPEVGLANTQLLGPRGVANFYLQTRNVELENALRQLIDRVEQVQATAQDDDWTAVMVQWGNAVPMEHGEQHARRVSQARSA
jgi:streptogramin lyase